ncbi:sporulation integral membrane protein YtvI [Texcoconibacillus texcoconensis]|uniref:Sporulation integral membrane protein YtvI n=1 Tax=Texcoconibacillus texcoconensis TaxID=1095777 RepID=A0A840QMV5_9BACI|nr:sporulation integral membrane protein YtvI [Texcoconibacillus texcoconensis]MBB5172722.1 sporulation integral membrane protein YtvI [Texcoconibacillus texcoconensis]
MKARNHVMIWLRIVYVLLAVTGFFVGVWLLFPYTYPFFIAFFIAFVTVPFVNILANRFQWPRWLAVLFVLAMISIFLFGILSVIIAELISGSLYLARTLPSHIQQFIHLAEQWISHTAVPIYERFTSLFQSLNVEQQQTILSSLDSIINQVGETTSILLNQVLQQISDFLMNIPDFATAIVFSLLATFFIAKDWPRFMRLYVQWVPSQIQNYIRSLISDMKGAVVGYIFAQITLVSATAVIVLIGLIILDVDYALTIAFFTAIVDFIPYLGTGLIFIPWLIYTFFTEQWTLAIGLSVLYAVVILQRQFMEPKVLSKNIGVEPLALLFALFVSYKLFGFLGLVIGPIALVVIQSIIQTGLFRDLRQFIIGSQK